MNEFVLNIFPQGSLSNSVITTVWIGILVSTLLNLRLGWSLSGLVIPGYLVPLLIVKPWAACVVITEGILTYFIVIWSFEYMSHFGIWSSVFGRDRFFALLLFSVIVRIFLDSWILPVIGEWLTQTYAIQFDYRNHLHSFGLVIVALIANQFWKPGFFRGIFPFSAILLVTFLIVRFGLMEYTNFSISNLGYMYEDIASSILASPKAYIILLTTAFIASHMNLNYGWEYSGILIPSLIALLWYEPSKILASLVETFVIICFAVLLLKLPMLKKITIEGARKILLFFNISYAYKYILALILLNFFPEKKITDYYGFGYLLPSLLAIKMFDKEIVVQASRMTIQTSLTSVILASCIGFSLTIFPKIWIASPSPDAVALTEIKNLPQERLIDFIRKEKVRFYQNRLKAHTVIPLPREIEIFAEGIRSIAAYDKSYDERLLEKAQQLFAEVNFRISRLGTRFLYVHEFEPQRGWGSYMIDTQSEKQIIIEVPFPIAEKGSMEAATWIFTVMEGKALALNSPRPISSHGAGFENALSSSRSFFHTFHKIFANNDVLQVRAYTSRSLRALSGLRRPETHIELPELESSLWITGALPAGLQLRLLEDLITDYRVEWGKTPMRNLQRETTGSGFAELYLNRSDIRKLFYKPILIENEIPFQVHEQRIDGYLQDWLLSGKANLAEEGSGKYIAPKMEELLFFDEEIISPLDIISTKEFKSGTWTDVGKEELSAISASASIMGYQIIQYRHRISGHDYIILMEKEGPMANKYWGTYVFRLGNCAPYMIQIPRPVYELNVFEFAVSLFERVKAKTLLISGTHKDANIDGSSDLIRIRNKENLFNLVNQVILRDSHKEHMMAVQIRALGLNEDQPVTKKDVLISFNDGIQGPVEESPLANNLIDILEKDQMSIQFIDGSPETAGYEVGGLPQSLYLDETVNKEFAILWVSPLTRAYHRQQTDNWWQEVQFQAVEIPTITDYLHTYLVSKTTWDATAKVAPALSELIQHYTDHQDIIDLLSLVNIWPQYQFKRFIDLNTRQSFLFVFNKKFQLILVANLFPKNKRTVYISSDGSVDNKSLSRFVNTRSSWLVNKTP